MKTAIAAVVALTVVASGLVAQEKRQQEIDLQAAIRTETVDGDLDKAITEYSAIVAKYASDRAVVAKALVQMAGCHQKRGDAQANSIYERILREFADQTDAVAVARAKLGGPRNGSSASAMAYRRAWANSDTVEVDTTGTISPDGRYLSYVDWDTGDLALRDLVAGSTRALTNKGTWNTSPEFAEQSAVSRDGKRVAYAWFDGKQQYQLRILDLTAPGHPQPRVLLVRDDVEWIAPHDWSPDGKSIAVFVATNLKTDLALVSVADGSLRRLRPVHWQDVTKAVFSPDGRSLACSLVVNTSNGEDRDVFVIDVATGRESRVAHNPSRDFAIGWSPDGSRLLFGSDRGGSIGLWAQPFANGVQSGSAEIVKSEIGHVPLGVTKQGALFVGVQAGGRNVYLAEVDFASGRLVRAPERTADRFIGLNEWPDWSRDGKFMSHVYARNWVGRNPMISIRSLGSGAVREIPLNLGNSRNPLWASDGRWFVAQGVDAGGRRGIYRIDAYDGTVTPIVHSPPGQYYSHPELSPDGRKVYFTRRDERAIIERDLQTGSERVVLRRDGIGSVNVSPDGRSIATIQRTTPETFSAALVVPVAGGEPREVIRVEAPQVFTGSASWAPDGRQLMINTFWSDTKSDLERRETWLVPIDGGATRKLDLPGYTFGRIRVHPDGRRIAYQAGQLKSEVWVLENFLPAKH